MPRRYDYRERGIWTDQTASRVAGTIYQNTSGRKRRVSIIVTGATAGQVLSLLEVGSASPPTIGIQRWEIRVNAGAGAAHVVTLYTEIPRAWFYRLTVTTGSLTKWSEMDE
ncbi:MAG TPA: hypothetical protein VGR44_12090 [Methylomirabilota bacterium]|jgi:hypothetical protein|nr:hypothetical protein [Methylomirabilota bacterium]